MRVIARLLTLALVVSVVSCSGGGSTVPVVQDYTSSAAPVHAKPQSVIPPYQPCSGPTCTGHGCSPGDDSAGKTLTPDCIGRQDPVYNIQCPGAPSCSTGTAYNVGQPVSCVTSVGTFTTGCGGAPGDGGTGIAVFWAPNATCYQNLASGVSACFAIANPFAGFASGNLNIKYCWWASGPQTQHFFNVPASPNGSEVIGTYVDIVLNTTAVAFEGILASSTTASLGWGPPTGNPIPDPASQNSIATAVIFAKGMGTPFSGPVFSGWASQAYTSGNCKAAWPNG